MVGETSERDCEDLSEASMTSSIEVKDIECDLGLFTPTKGGGEWDGSNAPTSAILGIDVRERDLVRGLSGEVSSVAAPGPGLSSPRLERESSKTPSPSRLTLLALLPGLVVTQLRAGEPPYISPS